MKLALSVSIAASLFAGPANAQQVSGNSVYEACRSDGSVQLGFGIGYILGVIEGESFGAFVVLKQGQPNLTAKEGNELINGFMGHCIPSDASNEQLRDIVLRYLADHPGERHHPARGLIWSSMKAAFQCD